MPSTLTGLILVVLFIVPGFIMGAMFNRNISPRSVSDLQFSVTSITFSLVIHVIWAFWSFRIYTSWQAGNLLLNPSDFYWWLIIVILVSPFLAGILLAKLLAVNRLQPSLSWIGFSIDDRTTSCWDWFAAQRRGAWVIVEFRDGSRLGGRFGEQSRISFTPPDIGKTPRDIFLEQLYHIGDDGTFGDPIPSNTGAWINCSDIKALRIF